MRQTRNRSEVDDRVLAVLQDNAVSLLKIARRHSLCDDDAQDAYQRGLEIYLHRLDRVDPATAASWLRTVIKHEAMAIREHRIRLLGGGGELDIETVPAPEPEDRALAFDRVTRAAEALQRCKRDEVAAMVLKADGHSYDEICSVTGWSYTKVNRCLTEGRSRFLARYAEIESGAECERVAPLLSMIVDGEATPVQMADARPHLRNCAACRATLRELSESQVAIHFLMPGGFVVAGGAGLPDGTAGFFSRAYEMLVGGLHDRLAVSALKAQHAVEAVSATKVAAVAASAAAVAGGGAVAVERTRVEPVAKRAEVRRPAPRPAAPKEPKAAPAAHRPVVERRAPRVQEARPVARTAPAASGGKAKPPQEFGFEAAPKASPASASAPVATAAPAQKKPATEDFGFER
jgi:DNA-directed RNA polymerase specialized sigma24 family protein